MIRVGIAQFLSSLLVPMFNDEATVVYKKVGEIRFFQSVERKDYLNERRGSNIVWGEDPGVTYSVKTRVGVEGEREDLSQESFESDIRNKEIYK